MHLPHVPDACQNQPAASLHVVGKVICTTGSVLVQDQSWSVYDMYVSAAWLDAQDDSPSGSSVSRSVAESHYTAVTVTPV